MAYSKSAVNRAGEEIADQVLEIALQGFRRTHENRARFIAAMEIVDWWRSEHARPLTLVAANLRYYAAEVGDPVVAQRLKRLPTIASKIAREPRMKLARMGDIGGVRAVVPDQDSAYHVAKRLRKNWTIVKFRDYVAAPKDDGYRALHLINRHRGRLVEIQVRTPLQDHWANYVELLSRWIAPDLKFGGGPTELRQMLFELASLSAEVDSGEFSPGVARAKLQEIRDWVDRVKEEQANEP